MQLDGLIKGRRSVRSFTSDDVPDEMVLKLLEAARWAPSAGNCQPWRFVVVKSKGARLELCEKAYRADWLAQAPVIIAVCLDITLTEQRYRQRGRELYCFQDTGAAIQNILLSAKNEGLGTCWIGAFDEDACRQALELPDELRPVALIPVGYAASEPARRDRKELSELVKFK